MASMNALPDEILSKILSYLPDRAFLPTAHVNKRFHDTWLKGESKSYTESNEGDVRGPRASSKRTTNPLQIGNLFQSHWNKKPSALSTKLLEYFVSCGWNEPVMIQRVLREAAARGDVEGMMYLVDSKDWLCNMRDADICTVAGAAGHLKALRWLREQKQWPWDPTEVLREASENLHVVVMTYVEQNSEGYDIQSPSYGDGLPW